MNSACDFPSLYLRVLSYKTRRLSVCLAGPLSQLQMMGIRRFHQGQVYSRRSITITSLPPAGITRRSASPPAINLWNFCCVSMRTQHTLKPALSQKWKGLPSAERSLCALTGPGYRQRPLGPTRTPSTRPSASPGPIMAWGWRGGGGPFS